MDAKTKPVVNLIDTDGNAFNVLGLCLRAARKAGWSNEERRKFSDEAMGGDYDHLPDRHEVL